MTEEIRNPSKLLKFKSWLTLDEAARHLSSAFGEEVSRADVLRLGLDGHLTLSVNFVNHAVAKEGRVVPLSEARRCIGLDGVTEVIFGTPLNENEVLDFKDSPNQILIGIFDLAMIGAECIDCEHQFQQLTGGPAIELFDMEGTFVKTTSGRYFQIQEQYAAKPDNESPMTKWKKPEYHPAGGLPDDSVLVVRTSALFELEKLLHQSIDEVAKMDRPIEQRERTTLLIILAALAKEARIDVLKPSKAASLIDSLTCQLGSRVAARTIENHLKNIPNALERRANTGA